MINWEGYCKGEGLPGPNFRAWAPIGDRLPGTLGGSVAWLPRLLPRLDALEGVGAGSLQVLKRGGAAIRGPGALATPPVAALGAWMDRLLASIAQEATITPQPNPLRLALGLLLLCLGPATAAALLLHKTLDASAGTE